jgi:hypothetical protein
MASRENTPLICELTVNVWEYGPSDIKIEFNTLHTICRLHTYFASVFNPTEGDFYKLAEKKGLNLAEAEAEFRRVFRVKKQKYLNSPSRYSGKDRPSIRTSHSRYNKKTNREGF